jgi:subtilase family serine protease
MAPGASQLVVGGDSCNTGDFGLQGLFDAVLAVLGNGNHPLATIASNSWGSGDEAQAPFLTDIEHAFLVRSAAEGVGMYWATGDISGNGAPTTDPFAIGVGGTTLGIGKTGHRIFETGWSTDLALLDRRQWFDVGEQGAASGGPSLLFKEPGYQKGVVPAAMTKAPGNRGGPVRSAPDISADADPFTGFNTGILLFPKNKPPKFVEIPIGGTSLSAPLVAGVVAAAQQGQGKSFGFINPVLYRLGHGAFFDATPLTRASPTLWRGTACGQHDCGITLLGTFDVQSNDMFGYTGQVTVKGYDNMTGRGVPAGQAFISALRKAER